MEPEINTRRSGGARQRSQRHAGFFFLVPLLMASLALAACGGTNNSGGADADSFYKGKTVTLVVGYAPGGLYDTFARLLAKVLPEYMPGDPKVVVQNMDGAGSLLALNKVYNASEQDGTEVVTFDEGALLQQLVGGEGVNYDMQKMQFVGSLQHSPNAVFVRSDLDIHSYADLKKWNSAGNTLTIGATAPGSLNYANATIIGKSLGLKYKVVPGYEGAPDILQAMASKEADALVLTVGSAQVQPFIEDGSVELLFTDSGDIDPSAFPETEGKEDLNDLITGDALALYRLANTPRDLSRPYAVGPEVPGDRVEVLRTAFAQAAKDPSFIESVETANVPFIDPRTGAQNDQTVAEFFDSPPDLIGRLKTLLTVE